MWTEGFKYRQKKMDMAAQDRTEIDGDKRSVAYVPLVVTRQ